jgi:phage regulator Rha-like protein
MSDNILKYNNIENKLLSIRNQQVILDSDVAELYGVETKRINEAVKNNPEKFPEGYLIQLSDSEWKSLRSKFSTLKENSENSRGKHTKYLPTAFTEKGLYMLATILKSKKATETTLAIIETYAKIREFSRTVATLTETQEELKQKSLLTKSAKIISDVLGDDMNVSDTETSIELNFAVLKIKHTIKRKGGLDKVSEEEPIYIKLND